MTMFLKKITEFNNEKYYAKMAAAWCLSYCLIKNFDKCVNDIRISNMHSWVFKKGITKAIESQRLNSMQKDILKELRKSR